MARFDINPSRDVLTPQMRDSMNAILRGDKVEKDIKNNKIAEDMTGRPFAGVPSEVRADIPSYLTEPAGEGGAGSDVGGRPITTQQINFQLQDEINAKFNKGAGGMPAEQMPYQGGRQGTVTPMGTRVQSSDPLIQFAANNTLNWEARRDKNGNIAVYNLPSGDMGGSYEVAGINDRYHPEAAKRLASIPAEQRDQAAAEYIRSFTAPAVDLMPDKLKAFAQDMAFNRGIGGMTKYMQQGLNYLGANVKIDGALGKNTLTAINSVDPIKLMQAASMAQKSDENAKAEANPDRVKFLPGLNNRINNRLDAGIKYAMGIKPGPNTSVKDSMPIIPGQEQKQEQKPNNEFQGGLAMGVSRVPSATMPEEGTLPFIPGIEPFPKREPDEFMPRPLGLG